MLIQYFSFTGEKILESHLSGFEGYHKAFLLPNDLFQQIETYDNEILTYVSAYITDDLEIDAFLTKYAKIENIEFYKLIEKNGIHKKYENFTLKNGKKDHTTIRIQVFGRGMFPIYDEALNSVRETSFVDKFYYYDYKNFIIEFEFTYNVDGSFQGLVIHDGDMLVDTTDLTVDPENVGIGKNKFDFNWKGMEYYKNATPVMPVNHIVLNHIRHNFG